jgi:acetolactate synthase-1/2/3 large subunit
MTGARVLFNSLLKHNVKHVFGYPGGAILPVLNEFYNQDKIKYILTRTETGASFMAEGYAKATKKPGVVMVTSGPGALNIMTSMQNALSDGTAVLALTGQVSTAVLGTDAFQEADVIGISKPCTKWNNMITDPKLISTTVDKAFHYMTDKRHGPVLLDLPKNIMSSPQEDQSDWKIRQNHNRNSSLADSTVSYNDIYSLITNARRPIVLAGQGVFQSDCVDLFRVFVDLYNLPVTTTLLGLGIVDERGTNSLKMLGMHGSYASNMAIQNSDLLLNFGSRFDDRIIGNPAKFAPLAKIVHMDVLSKNINKTVRTGLYRVEDCLTVLEGLLEFEKPTKMFYQVEWHKQIALWKRTGFICKESGSDGVLQGRHVLSCLNRLIHSSSSSSSSSSDYSYTIVADVGAHQMWAAQFIDYDYPRVKFVTSGGLGSMGFALPAAIGVKLGSPLPSERVICVCGDGGFQMTFQELSTAIENNIGIKVIILNNSYQLMVKIWQEKFYNNQKIGTKMNNPPFDMVCRALGCEALRIDSADGLDAKLKRFLEYDGPIVLNVITDSSESVLPMVSPGAALDDMILEETAEGFKGDAPC